MVSLGLLIHCPEEGEKKTKQIKLKIYKIINETC